MGPRATAGNLAVSITWPVRQMPLADGRTYFVRAPSCTPAGAPECVAYLGRARALVLYAHAAAGREDLEAASVWLHGIQRHLPDTVVAFAVSKGGTRLFDGGVCCTSEPVDDVGYLARVVDSIATSWSINRRRVGLYGISNGGILMLRAACERPGVFPVVTVLGATFTGPCGAGAIRIAQWHGAQDAAVPLNGGSVWILGQSRSLLPVASLAQRLVAGSVYELHVKPATGHMLTAAEGREALLWLQRNLPSS